MVRGGEVRDVRGADAGHVAFGAAIIRIALQSGRPRQCASLIGVAVQALLPIVRHLGSRIGKCVRIVAGDAAERSLAGAEALACLQLLDVVGVGMVVLSGQRPHEHGHELMKRQPGPVIGQLLPIADDFRHAQKVALLADCLAERGLQTRRVHDGRLLTRRRRGPLPMQLSRTVASLAANRMAPKGRRPIAPLGPFHVVDFIGVAGQAGGWICRSNRPTRFPKLGASAQRPSCAYQVIGDWNR